MNLSTKNKTVTQHHRRQKNSKQIWFMKRKDLQMQLYLIQNSKKRVKRGQEGAGQEALAAVALAAIAEAVAVAALYLVHPIALAQVVVAALRVLLLLKGRRDTVAVGRLRIKLGAVEAGVTPTEIGERGVRAGRG